jgi:Mg2+/Co2+ transporter CorC
LLKQAKLGIELGEGLIVGIEVSGFACIKIAALASLSAFDEGLGFIEGDEDLLGVVDAGLIPNEFGQLTARNESVRNQQDEQEDEAGDDAKALVDELHTLSGGGPK